MAFSSIGNFDFVAMSAIPTAPQKMVALEVRAGVPGVSAWITGPLGQRTQVTTVRDTVDFASALTLLAQYQALVGAGPQVVTYGGVILPFRVVVLSVAPEFAQRTGLGVGGRLGLSRGVCRATWELVSWVAP